MFFFLVLLNLHERFGFRNNILCKGEGNLSLSCTNIVRHRSLQRFQRYVEGKLYYSGFRYAIEYTISTLLFDI